MARTYRNRHSVPKGAVVRDDGLLYFPTCCPNRQAQRESRHKGSCCDTWKRLRTFRRGYYRQETKAYRVEHQRQFRASVKARMAHEDWENIPRFRRTSGWLSW